MPSLPNDDPVLRRLIEWAEARPAVRAVLLTSTRAVPGAAVDRLSDYDVILVARDVRPFFDDRRWIEEFGTVLVAYWDPQPVTELDGFPQGDGIAQVLNVVQYAGGLKIDFTVWPVELLDAIVAAGTLPHELDAGYRVLLDKDRLAERLRAPTYSAYLPSPPTAAAFQVHINDFLSDAPYVAKCLWRDELLPAKWCLDYDMIHVYLLPVLQWRAAIDEGWSRPAGSLGKGLKKRLPPDIWAELEQCYAGAVIEANWEALLRTMALFRRVALEVGAHFGYPYPEEQHRHVLEYVLHIRDGAPEG
jgi:aminoglycoside 6-adenylyltransferase